MEEAKDNQSNSNELVNNIRDSLYGDLSLNEFLSRVLPAESVLVNLFSDVKKGLHKESLVKLQVLAADPVIEEDPVFWVLLAKTQISCGDSAKAEAALRKAIDMPNLEMRFKVQIYHIMQIMGKVSFQEANKILGAVVEMGQKDKSLAIVAAFADGQGCMWSSHDKEIFSVQNNATVKASAKELIESLKKVMPHLMKVRTRLLPLAGRLRFSAITSSGILAREDSIKMIEAPNFYMNPAFTAMNYLLNSLVLLKQKKP